MRRDIDQVTRKQGSYFSLLSNTNTAGSSFSFLCRLHDSKVPSWVGVLCKHQRPSANGGLAEGAEGAEQEKWELQNLKPGLLHRGSLTVTTWLCGPFVTSSWCSPASQPTFPSSLAWCSPCSATSSLLSQRSENRGGPLENGIQVKIPMKTMKSWAPAEGPAGAYTAHYSGMASSSNTKLAEQSWLKWQLAHKKQELPPNSLSVNEKVTFVRSF